MHKHNFNLLKEDLEHILRHTGDIWEDIREKRLFITGGTGFFGKWLLESLVYANEKLNLNVSALVLTRDSELFKREAPHLATNRAIMLYNGDIRNFSFPEGEFSHIIHAAATSAIATFNHETPQMKFDTVVLGTRRVLDFAVQCNAKKMLFTSSGAVYGKQPFNIPCISEDYNGIPNPHDPDSIWGIGKRTAEFLCIYYSKRYGIETKIARCFSFVGPYLQLDIHYAIGNFVRDALNGGPIRINGDGTPYRSYLYAADLAIWLWTIFLHDTPCQIYNVGSEEAVTIKDLAHLVSACAGDPPPEIIISRHPVPGKEPERYIPSVKKANKDLGLDSWIHLKESLYKTIRWNQKKREMHCFADTYLKKDHFIKQLKSITGNN